MLTPGTPPPPGAAALDSSMLLPPLGELLPPISPLIPPGTLLAQGGIAQPAAGGDMGATLKADETLEQLGKGLKDFSTRTSSFVASQAPRVRAAQRSATEYMNKAAHELGNAENRRSFVQKYRRWLMAGAGGMGCLLLAGWGMMHHLATEKATKSVHDALLSANLLDVVQYDGVSASPFGTVWLSNVKWHVTPNADITIASLGISNIDTAHPVPHHLDISASGMDIPVQKLLNSGSGMMMPDVLNRFVHATARDGYNNLRGSFELAYRLQDAKSLMDIRTSATLDDYVSWKGHVELSQFSSVLLDPSLFALLSPNKRGINGFLVFNILQSMSRVSVQNEDITLDTTPQARREKELPGTPLPVDEANAPKNAMIAIKENQARRAGLSDDQAHLAALLDTDNLPAFNLKSDSKNAVPLNELKDMNLPELMQRLNATLSQL